MLAPTLSLTHLQSASEIFINLPAAVLSPRAFRPPNVPSLAQKPLKTKPGSFYATLVKRSWKFFNGHKPVSHSLLQLAAVTTGIVTTSPSSWKRMAV